VGDTTTGLIPQGLHPSAAAYLAALMSSSYSPSRTEIDAINNLVLGLVANGLLTKMQVIFPIMGGTATTHKWNLKDTTAFPITFTGNWTHTSSGMKTTTLSVSNYATFVYNPSLHATTFNAHMSVYLGTTIASTSVVPIGCNTTAGGFFQMNSGTVSANSLVQCPITGVGIVSYSFPTNRGYIIGSRIANNIHKAYLNGGLVGTNTTTVASNLPNSLVNLGCGFSNNTSWTNPTDQRFQFITVGTGLTDLEARIMATLVQAYQTSLSRNI
jgi:hypothetical protein